ncbi:hypothetical protein B194_2673 [Serratia plymuthica A30]|nr:hypothetical protein B194_2673 [Serratia plymuthica A30]
MLFSKYCLFMHLQLVVFKLIYRGFSFLAYYIDLIDVH